MGVPGLRIIAAAGAVVAAGFIGGCATRGAGEFGSTSMAGPSSARHACCVVAPATDEQQALGRTAARFVGARRIEVRGRRLPFDCSGLARAIYLTHGVDLYDGVEAEDLATGVQLIYRHVAAHGRLHRGPDPRPGDLVFFHNTWDRDRDGRLDDLLTHVGIVERVEEDGTVVFVSRVSRGVQRYRMNLAAPGRHRADDGRLLNDYLRRKRRGDPRATRYLAGELFAAFGRLAD